MTTLESLQAELDTIKARNKKVELDKKWEGSGMRKVLIAGLTYACIVVYLHIIAVPNPWINAVVPVLGFYLSTITVSFVKKEWIKKQVN